MVVSLLLALVVAAPQPSGGVRVEARATATIQRAVTLQSGTAAARDTDVAATRQEPRRCATSGAPNADCGLIVYDLP